MRNYMMIMLCAALSFAASAATLTPADSGWYAIASPAYYQRQCNVVVDSVQVGAACQYRVSVMCIQDGVGYQTGRGFNHPIQTPITLPLYRPPSTTPVGQIEIIALGAAPVFGLNSAASPWSRAAAYTGQSCAGTGLVGRKDR